MSLHCVVIEWNRALADLTGITRAEVVGRRFADIVAELRLSGPYRAAALRRIGLACSDVAADIDDPGGYDDEETRAERFFPLPLPVE